ncbi:MAG: HlyC/CorC family transporter [Muribaculaceae bacterium]|nr:HlyC/CorC family transporter [Muribaculaceae bacterium]MBR4722965.1 HlyC/CorC family transporter [Muribaculaceae bacterium]MBR5435694.1 HlyC/CorC family transporter [Muribaculaceae bacterium]
MSLSAAIIIAVVSLIFSALFSGSEIAFITSDRVSVEIDIKRGGLVSRIIDRFYDNPSLFITTILVGNNIMLVVYGMGAAWLLDRWFIDDWQTSDAVKLIVETLISTLVVLLVGEFFPKATFRINPYKSLRLIALPLYLFYWILWPISKFTAWLSSALMRLFHVDNDDKEFEVISIGDLSRYLEQTIDDHPSDRPVENEVKIFHNAIDFSSTKLHDCMIPRNEIVAVNIDTATPESLRELFTATGRSKIIVYKEDIDNICGYIHVSEFLRDATDWKDKIKAVEFAPETFLADKMMRRLLADKRSVAVVIDEFGGTAGLVTLEDLVEEIFGNIEDEHDKSTSSWRKTAPDTYEISGRAEISQINDELQLDIPEDDEYQTVAGYIITNTGSIPEKGEVITLGENTFTILKKSATRIELVKVKVPKPIAAEPAEEQKVN